MDLRDFEAGAFRTNARIWLTKSVFFPKGAPTFPLAEARLESQKEKLAQQFKKNYSEQIDPGEETEDDESEDEESRAIYEQQRKVGGSQVDKDFEDDLFDDARGPLDSEDEDATIGSGFGGQNAPQPQAIPKDFIKHFRK